MAIGDMAIGDSDRLATRVGLLQTGDPVRYQTTVPFFSRKIIEIR